MAEPFVGEICCFGFNFSPRDWAKCNGQLIPIAQDEALFAILGTIYGGDGVTTFALPNLQGRIPMHWGTSPGLNTVIGEVMGTDTVTLTSSQLPQHVHPIYSGDVATGAVGENTAIPNFNSYLSNSTPPNRVYNNAPPSITQAFSPRAVSGAGGNQPHENMQPYLALNFCIAMYGVFPSHN